MNTESLPLSEVERILGEHAQVWKFIGGFTSSVCNKDNSPWPCQHEAYRLALTARDALRDAATLREKADLYQHDLYRIAGALDIGARAYSGHEAMDRDILPRIRALMKAHPAIGLHDDSCEVCRAALARTTPADAP